MGCTDQKVRIINKKGNGIATVPASADHRDGSWLSTDIYEGEWYLDTSTGIAYTRNGSNIIQFTGTSSEVVTNINFADSPFTPTTKKETILVSSAGGSIKIDLPPSASNEGALYRIKKIDATTNPILVDPDGSETIEGATDYTLNQQNQVVEIICFSTNWFILNEYIETGDTSLAVDLDSALSNVTRTVSGGRTFFEITHSLNTLDIMVEIWRKSDGRTLTWRVERTGVNTVEVSRAGTVADGLHRIKILK